ncbi:MAG: peptidoglycan-binding protein [Cyanobacteria bacterium J06628_6]
MGNARRSVQWFSILAASVGLLPGRMGTAAEITEPVQPPQMAQGVDRPVLQLGSVGSAVSEVQALLTLLGHYNGPVDGFYREQTQTAVAQFQTAAGVNADGIVGPTTWQKLLPRPGEVAQAAAPPTPAPTPAPTPTPTPTPAPTPTPDPEPEPTAVGLPVLREGMYGPAVTRLQERLKTLGVYGGEIDGVFGPQTAAAVRQIQQRNDLEADGVVGPRTWSILLR